MHMNTKQTVTLTRPVFEHLVSHRVIAEIQTHGVLVMFESGEVKGYRSEASALRAIKRRDEREAKELTSGAVMTTIEWRS